MLKKFIVIVIIAHFVSAGAAYADNPQPGFFPKGYAGDPADIKNNIQNKSAKPPDSSEGAQPEESKKDSSQDVSGDKIENDEPKDSADQDEEQDDDKEESSLLGGGAAKANLIPVKAIGGVVNAVDANKFKEEMNSLVDLATTYDFSIGHIYAIGDYTKAADMDLVMKVVARGGVIEPRLTPPEAIGVTTSPVWILETDKGDVVLEGVSSIEPFLTSKGEFLDSTPKPISLPGS